mmetsp:Transcript_72421/g.143587  ORF Transcript_72421/g.143587 Transcript_72421/m.143587 type:complete len:283 (-) Transcript_72421:290-1138(-)
MSDLVGRVVGAASQGAVGAVVAANLSAVTEPVVNAMLVKRATLAEALKEVDAQRVAKYLKTTLATNFIKFPFFEVTNMLVGGVQLPPTLKGALTGTVFCTTTLPITNYRFRKSMDLPITVSNLYQAYLPTVLRDIIYGIARNKAMAFLVGLNPQRAGTNIGRFTNMFATVLAACVLSAPGNELRGYCLQPAERRQSFSDFFQPAKFVRSTSVGAVIMAISLGVGTLATPQVERLVARLKEYFAKNPIGILLVMLFALHQVLEGRRQKQMIKACGGSGNEDSA